MNHVERFRAVMNFQPVDRLPRWEWAMWWDQTIARWHGEGLPAGIGLQPGLRHRAVLRSRSLPAVLVQHHRGHHRGDPASRRGDRRQHGRLPAGPAAAVSRPRTRRSRHGAVGRAAATGRGGRLGTLEGFFWFPRTLMGIERLMLRLLRPARTDPRDQPGSARVQPGPDRADCRVCVPTFMTHRRGHDLQSRADDLAADLRGVPGPVLPAAGAALKETGHPADRGHRRRRDAPAPWLLAVGVAGVLPLERQAGVDGMALRREFPTLRMVGHFDKMVMNQGEADTPRVRTADAADEDRRLHPQRGPPDPAGGVPGAIPPLPAVAQRIHDTVSRSRLTTGDLADTLECFHAIISHLSGRLRHHTGAASSSRRTTHVGLATRHG